MVSEQEAKELVNQRFSLLMQEVRSRHPNFPPVEIEYYDNKLAAGMAYYHPFRVAFNMPMLRENLADMLEETVAHELAHLVVHYRWRLKADLNIPRPQPHGREWKVIMRCWFNTEPRRTHQYDTSSTNARKQDRWAADCDCRTHAITTTRKMNMVVDGKIYICRSCNTRLTLTGEKA